MIRACERLVLRWGLGLGLALLACRPASPPGRPAEAVERFYAAVLAGDCTAVMGALGKAYRARVEQKGNCDKLLEEMREHPLESVLDTQVDGRNPAAQLVRARLRGHKTDVIIRVQAEGGQWKIFSL
ncbi:MAG TPA: hypothetical protein VH877_18005 [Polyangia bacterium]|jgi:hypothetical protein|nr:hypothetical protein [Polyangia bacterium]